MGINDLPSEIRRFKEIREDHDFTQAEFAEKLGIKNSTADIERGRTKLSGQVITELLRLFQVNPLWIYGYSNQKHLDTSKGDVSPKVVVVDKEDNENMVLVNQKAAAGYPNNIADVEYKGNLDQIIESLKKNNFSNKYIDQNGYKIYNNVVLKIKPFHYGRKIKDFYPINNNFSCQSEILGILADGNMVPCCLSYDDSISMGNIKNQSLINTLHQNKFLKNLRSKKGEKHLTCKKCFGEPTKRGAHVRNILNFVRN